MSRPALTLTALVVVAALLFAGCTGSPGGTTEPTTDASAPAAAWPRTIEHAAGSTTIDAQPVTIVSLSPSLTGALLSIDAPLKAAAATTITALTDDKGFFLQWAEVADERGVDVLYRNLELDLDAVDAAEPDLIIGSANGGDSTLDAYDQLSDIAPTVLFDYSKPTWQELTQQIAAAVGLETKADAVLEEFDTWVAGQAKLIEKPDQPVNALVYLGADGVRSFTSDGPQGQLLTALGFEYHDVPADYTTGTGPGSVPVTVENLPFAFADAQTIFVVPLTSDDTAHFRAEPVVANLPAVAGDRVFSLGSVAFRLDYYSATMTVELLVSEFGS